MVNQGRFGVNRICKLTGISKATYYAAQNPADRFEAKYMGIKIRVEKVIERHPAYGIKRIKAVKPTFVSIKTLSAKWSTAGAWD